MTASKMVASIVEDGVRSINSPSKSPALKLACKNLGIEANYVALENYLIGFVVTKQENA